MGTVVLLGVATASFLPLAGTALLSWSLGVCAVLTGADLLPLALRAARQPPPQVAALMWAVNGWALVLAAATAAVLIARIGVYTVAPAALLARGPAWSGRP